MVGLSQRHLSSSTHLKAIPGYHNASVEMAKVLAPHHNSSRRGVKPLSLQHRISEQELRRRVSKHRVIKKLNPKTFFNHSFYSPRDEVVENYDVPILLQPKLNIRDSHPVHFIVASSPGDVNRRAAIRETWGSVARGVPWPGKELSLPVRLTFVLGVSHTRNGLLQAHGTDLASEKQGGDILQFDMIDSYQNLTRKILLAMQWVVSSCNNVQYIVKVDQDNFANVPLLTSFLKHHGQSHSIYGYIYDGGYPNRKGRWAVSRTAYPLDKYPVYASGTAYVVSRSAAETLLRLCPYYHYIPIEDAFITGVLASVGSIDRFHVDAFAHHMSSSPSACTFITDRKFFGNNMTEFHLRAAWDSVARGTMCGKRPVV